jgi:hypothetical protein
MGTRRELALGRIGNKGIVTRIAAQYLYCRASALARGGTGQVERPPTGRPAVAGYPFDRKSLRNASRIKPFI